MSRRALSTLGPVVAVLLIVLLLEWGRGDDAADRVESDASSATVGSTPAPSSPSATAPDGQVDGSSDLPWIEVSDLPKQARATLALIVAGGPFPYPGKDGSTFGNLEGLLPKEPRGYYAEYTVPTPGSRDRGARRIITGDGGEFYWTADHYAHFERIRR